LSEVLAVIQNVSGVAFVDVEENSFRKTTRVASSVTEILAVNGYLAAHVPASGADSTLAEPAELLILDETSLPRLEVSL
jgi:hypothetical protein